MSDLRHLVPEAIDVVTEWVSEQEGVSLPLEVIGAMLALTEAARKVANPDIEAAMTAADQLIERVKAGNQATYEDVLAIVDAALYGKDN